MIYRGEIYYGEKQTSLFVIYGSRKNVTEAVTAAFLHYENQDIGPTMSIDNLFRYEFEVFKGLLSKDRSGFRLPPDEVSGIEVPRRRFRLRKKQEESVI